MGWQWLHWSDTFGLRPLKIEVIQLRHSLCLSGFLHPAVSTHTCFLSCIQLHSQPADTYVPLSGTNTIAKFSLLPVFFESFWTFCQLILLFLFSTSTVCHAQLLPPLASLGFVCLPSSVDSCLKAHSCHDGPRNQPSSTLFHLNYNKRLVVLTTIQCATRRIKIGAKPDRKR